MSKNGIGRIQNCGKDLVSGQTIIYCVGQNSEIADSKFSVKITEGEYMFYSVEVARNLKGKTVLFNYTAMSDTRIPRGITFKSVLE